jgi:hypothetical protein
MQALRLASFVAPWYGRREKVMNNRLYLVAYRRQEDRNALANFYVYQQEGSVMQYSAGRQVAYIDTPTYMKLGQQIKKLQYALPIAQKVVETPLTHGELLSRITELQKATEGCHHRFAVTVARYSVLQVLDTAPVTWMWMEQNLTYQQRMVLVRRFAQREKLDERAAQVRLRRRGIPFQEYYDIAYASGWPV